MHSAFCIANTVGREFDKLTGLHYYRARWYDASVGRFISEDPIGLAGGINQFGYVGGNPQNLTDPSGLIPTAGDLADGLDGYVDRAKRAVSPDYDTFGWYGKFAVDFHVGVSTDIAKMVYDPLRLGQGFGCAIYGEGLAWWQRGLLGIQDIGRAVAIASVVGGVVSKAAGLATRSAVPTASNGLPTQLHHFATNKHKTYKPQMETIAKEFGLELDGAWNKQAMPHLGRHPNLYHEFVLEGMQKAKAGAGTNQTKFLNLFDEYVKQPVIQNPELLRKSGW